MADGDRFQVDDLDVSVLQSVQDTGHAAGFRAAQLLRDLVRDNDVVRVVFAAAPSQRYLLEYLSTAPGIAWEKVHAFHMDEYVDLKPDADQRFATWLDKTLFRHLDLGAITLMRTDGDLDDRAQEYASALGEEPLDLVLLGIGENGHLAFNEPPDADFDDPESVRTVRLDDRSREQQVHDGLFATIDDVPYYALTLTIPRLMHSRHAICVASGANKHEAVTQMLSKPVSAACPASVLRTHPSARLYLDAHAYQPSGVG